MDIAVCGAQALFMQGGAELAIDNLVEACRQAGHRAESVRIPVAWDKGRLLDAPLAWRLVPMDVDLVVAVNFPAYFVRHPRKVVWLFHQHRGAYDLVDAPWSDLGLDDDSLEVQARLSDWDTRALEEASRIFTISQVAADRLARFNGMSGQPLYHPPPLHDRLHAGAFGGYVFTPNRLERNKRPDITVDALAHCRADIRAVVAGRGSMADELRDKAMASGTLSRLDLPGFVSDDDLIELYAGCLAVVYAPVDEDYGYVTLQAFRAGKPVITSSDSGGVLEWVEDGVNGIVTDGSPTQVGAAIDRLAADPDLARRMGDAGAAKVADLAWGPVVEALTQP